MRQIPGLRRELGIIFQDFQLLPDRTAYDNLDIVLRAYGINKQYERCGRIEEALWHVGLATKGYKYPHELSEGEQQSLAVARALLLRPRVVLADEPTANLDTESGIHITGLLHRLTGETGAAVLMSTHNVRVIEQYPARIIDLDKIKNG